MNSISKSCLHLISFLDALKLVHGFPNRSLRYLYIILPLLAVVLTLATPALAQAQDSDSDGMPDAWEEQYSCLDPLYPDDDLDPDGDGIVNLSEYTYSVDPCSILFPIADSPAAELALCADFGGSGFDYLVPVLGQPSQAMFIEVAAGSRNFTVDLPEGAGDFPVVAFDGTNHMIAWMDYSLITDAQVMVQLIDVTGDTLGTAAPVSGPLDPDGSGRLNMAFGDSVYLVTWEEPDPTSFDSDIYGQIVSVSGATIGPVIPIAVDNAGPFEGDDDDGDASIAFDGTNFLVVFTAERRPGSYDRQDVYGQFVSQDGSLVGSNFVISENDYPSSNPTALVFLGTNYLALWPEEFAGDTSWEVMGIEVSPAGSVVGSTITFAGGPGGQFFPTAAVDDVGGYLVAWNEMDDWDVMGRYYSIGSGPVGPAFPIWADDRGQIGGVAVYGDGQFLALVNQYINVIQDGPWTFDNAYGRFLEPLSSGDTTPPSTPGNLTAWESGDLEISLSWEVSSDDTGVAGYHVYWGAMLVGTFSPNHARLEPPDPNVEYCLTVRAFDFAGNESSDSSPACAVNRLQLKVRGVDSELGEGIIQAGRPGGAEVYNILPTATTVTVEFQDPTSGTWLAATNVYLARYDGMVVFYAPSGITAGSSYIRVTIDGRVSAPFPVTVASGTYVPGPYTVSGRVTHLGSGVPGAFVVALVPDPYDEGDLFSNLASTNALGQFSMDLEAGDYMIYANLDGASFLGGMTVLTVSGNTTLADLELTTGFVYSGTVVDSVNSSIAVGGGEIEVCAGEDQCGYSVVFVDGSFRVVVGGGTNYQYFVNLDPVLLYLPAQGMVGTIDADLPNQIIPMTKGDLLSMRLVNESQGPVGGLQVMVNDNWEPEVYSDAFGYAGVPVVSGGTVSLEIRNHDYLNLPYLNGRINQLYVPSGGIDLGNLTIYSGYLVTGEIQNSFGDTVWGHLDIQYNGALPPGSDFDQIVTCTDTNLNGSFAGRAYPGDSWFTISFHEYNQRFGTSYIDIGELMFFDGDTNLGIIVVDSGVRMTGRVVDGEGYPLTNVEVNCDNYTRGHYPFSWLGDGDTNFMLIIYPGEDYECWVWDNNVWQSTNFPANPYNCTVDCNVGDIVIDYSEPDADGDGMPDAYEQTNFCLDYLTGDSLVDYDTDGLTNLQEYNLGTEPCYTDTDSDGTDDGVEVTAGSNPIDWRVFPRFSEGPDTRITFNASESSLPELAWGHTAFAVVWQDNGAGPYEVYRQRLAADGSTLDLPVQLSDALYDSNKPVIASQELGFTSVWVDYQYTNPDLFYALMGDTTYWNGGQVTSLTSSELDPYLHKIPISSWDAGFVWADDRNGNWEIYYDSVDADSMLRGWDARITQDGSTSDNPAIAWSGNDFGLVWEDNREGATEVFFVRINWMGGKIGTDARVTTTAGYESTSPAIVWTGSEFGLAWSDAGDGNQEIYFRRLSMTGAPLGGEMRISYSMGVSDLPVLAWDGTNFGLAWQDNTYGQWQTWFTVLGADGTVVSPETSFGVMGFNAQEPALVFGDSVFALAWQDDRDGNGEVYFTSVAWDSDGDGLADTLESNLYLTNPGDWDSDDDGMPDGWEVASSSCGLNPLYGDSMSDPDSDGQNNLLEYSAQTDPCVNNGGGGDSDFDGMPDTWEQSHYCMNYLVGDSLSDYDTDNLTNLNEFYASTDPCDPDSDDDFMPDDFEAANNFCLNPLSGDSLLDGDFDNLDNLREFYAGTEPCNPDTDYDFMPDGWEMDYTGCGLSPLAGDSLGDPDTDGLANLGEYNAGTDPCQYDTDFDFMPDGFEAANNFCLNPLSGDSLLDGDFDNLDNLREFYAGTEPCNPDTDYDFMPDGWEMDYTGCGLSPLTGDSTGDPDADGLANLGEYNAGTDPCQYDTDFDFMPDGFEAANNFCLNPLSGDSLLDGDFDNLDNLREFYAGTEPCNPDTDYDFMPDGWEMDYTGCGLSPLTGDSTGDPDTDGQNNLAEYYASTNPCVNEGGGDTDGDGMPDAYEQAHACLNYLVGDSLSDGDADNLTNFEEYTLTTDPCDYDSDDDFMPDGWETNNSFCGLDPLVGDSIIDADSDGLGNLEEYFSGTGPCLSDSDSDGSNDGEELSLGSNPLSGSITPTNFGTKLADEVRVTNQAHDQLSLAQAWTGSELGLSWYDNRFGNTEILFARLSPTGVQQGADLRVTSNSYAQYYPTIAFGTTLFGLAWQDSRDLGAEVYFARVSSAGVKLGAEGRLTSDPNTSTMPALTWSGSEFGLAWHENRDGNFEIYFTRAAADGREVGGDQRVSFAASNSQYPAVAWSGSEYGIAWHDNRSGNYDIYFVRLSDGGTLQGAELQLDSLTTDSMYPSLTWNGNEFALSWQDNRDGNYEIYFARVSDGGSLIGSESRISYAAQLSQLSMLAWNGAEYGVIWRDLRDGDYEIYFSRVAADGTPAGAESRLTSAAGMSNDPSISWSGSEYLTTWVENRDGNYQVYFARIGWEDPDGDGLTGAQEATAGTNPNNWDSDDDGMDDGWEVANSGCVYPLTGDSLADPDGDLVSNMAEYLAMTNPCFPPSDGDYDDDGMPDEYEFEHACLDPMVGDSVLDGDTDALTNLEEYINGTDPCDPDSDDDFMPDGWEFDNAFCGINPLFGDSLFDYDADALDNLREYQAGTEPCDSDSDDDSLPDGWEQTYYGCGANPLNGDSTWDLDEDELSNLGEYNAGSSPCEPDTDFDEMPDGWEAANSFCGLSPIFGDSLFDYDADALDNLREYQAGTSPCDSDTDDDLMPDGWEIDNSYSCILDPLYDDSSYDYDTDTLTNLQEYTAGTDPCSSDTDGDFMPDDWEVDNSGCGLSPLFGDSLFDYDADALDNLREYFAGTAPCDADSDDDGMTDGWEQANVGCGLSPLADDSAGDFDSDTLTNLQEFNLGSYPCDSDSDDDGMPDGWENTYSTCGMNLIAGDSLFDYDSDGQTNLTEYTLGSDPCSDDSDGDGMPDAWELANACAGISPTINDGALDGDTDGLSNLGEYQQAIDPCDSDSEDDGLSDGDEVNTWFTDPLDPDSDGDGFDDGEEVNYWQTNPAVFDLDSDADGLPDEVETNTGVYVGPYDTGTDPNDADSDDDGESDGVETILGAKPNDPDITPSPFGEKVGNDLRVSNDSMPSRNSALVWTGSEYGVTWHDFQSGNYEVYFARISSEGVKLGADLRVTSSAGGSENPKITWTGSEFGITWEDTRDLDAEIYFTRVSATGVEIGDDLRLTSSTGYSRKPSMVWTGSEYGVGWEDVRDGNYEIYFTRVSAAGVEQGDDTRLTNAVNDSLWCSLAWTGSEFGVSWDDTRTNNREIYFARLSASGIKVGSDLQLTSVGGYTSRPSLYWDGNQFGVTWSDQRAYPNYRIYFARVSSDGVKQGGDQMESAATEASQVSFLSGTGSEFGVTWDQDSRIWFGRLSSGGTKIGADQTLTTGTSSSSALAWSGSEYGLSWIDSRDGNEEIYFARLGRIDGDGDGLSVFEESAALTDPADWDTDDDLLPDGWEVDHACAGISPLISDAAIDYDTDGLDALAEYDAGTDPCDADSDDDFMDDGWEVDQGSVCGLDPLTGDSVGDPDADSLENLDEFYAGSNPCDPDTDTDGMTDGWEVANSCAGISPIVNDGGDDGDADTLSNYLEFQLTSNPCSPDSDSDSMPDYWEYGSAWCGLSLIEADGATDDDGDGLSNLGEWNAGTLPCIADSDGDNLPDGWEVNHACAGISPLVNDSLDDGDLDGLSNYNEYTATSDPCDADSDGDQMPDGWEYAHSGCGLNLLVGDSLGNPDSDALANLGEYLRRIDPCDNDSDDDGMVDGFEVIYVTHDFSCWGTNGCSTIPNCTPQTYNGHHYLFCSSPQTWSQAAGFCRSLGGDLVAVETAEENAFIVSNLTADTWLGFSEAQSPGTYVFNHGSPITYTGWDITNGQPGNDAPDEDCALFHQPFGFLWHDITCEAAISFVCEDNFHLNPASADSDGDLLPDPWENQFSGCGVSPNRADSATDPDADGLANFDEYTWMTNPCAADTDTDGRNDGDEVLYGSNPLVANGIPVSSCTSPAVVAGSTVHLDFFNETEPTALVRLYVSWNGSLYQDTGLSARAATGSWDYVAQFGQGTYRFYTRATFSPTRVEPLKHDPDTTTIVDWYPPESACLSPEWGGAEPFEVMFTGTEADATVHLYYRVDGGSWTDSGLTDGGTFGSFWFTPGGNGTYDFYTIAVDPAGNTEDPPATYDSRTLVDVTPPVTTSMVVSFDGPYLTMGSTVDINWTAATDPDSTVSYFYMLGTAPGGTDLLPPAGDDYICVSGSCTVTVTGVALPEGAEIYASVIARNQGGTPALPVVSDPAMVDTRGPELVASAPEDGDVLTGSTITISAVITDRASGIEASTYPQVMIDDRPLVRGVDFTEVWDGETVTISVTSSGLNKLVEIVPGSRLGSHSFTVIAADIAGGEMLDRTLAFTIEKPGLVVITPSTVTAPTNGDTIYFRVYGGIAPYRWTWTGGAAVVDGTTLEYAPGNTRGSFSVAAVDARGVSFTVPVKLEKLVFQIQPQAVGLAPGEFQQFKVIGGTPPYTWFALGGTIQIGVGDTFDYTAGGIYGENTISVIDSATIADVVTAKITITRDPGRAIIVVGGGLLDDNRLVNNLNYLGNFAYRTLIARGFTPDKILYFNPNPSQPFDGNGDGYLNDIDAAPTIARLEYAITDWAAGRSDTIGGVNFIAPSAPVSADVPLTVYLIDHGGVDQFLLNRTLDGATVVPVIITSTQLDGWVDQIQTEHPCRANVILDSCYSGTFIDNLGSGAVNRIVVTSATDLEPAFFTVNGTVSFSQFFLNAIMAGQDIKTSFNQAAAAIRGWSDQSPQLDDNGDGAYIAEGVGRDGLYAEGKFLGSEFFSGADTPDLVACPAVELSPGETASVCAELLNSTDIAGVFAVITPPGFDTPTSDGDFNSPKLEDGLIPIIYLTDPNEDGIYSFTFTPEQVGNIFKASGDYTVNIYAKDTLDNVSSPVTTHVYFVGGDIYEPDDSPEDANAFAVNGAGQLHNLYAPADEDWISFGATVGVPYTVYTDDLSPLCDTLIEIFFLDGTTVVSTGLSNDDYIGLESRVYFTPTETGTYYVRVVHSLGLAGAGTDYTLYINNELGGSGSGSMTGYVTDSVTGFGVYGAQVKMTISGVSTTITTTTNGYYVFSTLAPGTYSLLVRKPNYTDYNAVSISIQNGVQRTQNVSIAPKTGTGVLAGTITNSGGSPLGGVRLVISGLQLLSNSNGTYSIRLAAGTSHTLLAQSDGYSDYTATGIVVVATQTTTRNVVMTSAVTDTDGDGLIDSLEAGWCTSPSDPDTDDDGIPDGGLTGEDKNSNGVVDSGETNPCDADSDDDGHNDGATDCDSLDPNVWTSCGACVDLDGDTRYTGCDAYITHLGPDCSDANVNAWDTCATCNDNDGDTWYGVCNTYSGISGPDCDNNAATVYPDAPELCDSIDNQCPGNTGYGVVDETCDLDGDGLTSPEEASAGTDPNDPDTDDDGLNDGNEINSLGTNPLSWDSDDDNLPDGFEASNLSGHTVGLNLNPLSSSDGNTLDFDGDGIPNAHDYWNDFGVGDVSGSGVYVLDRAGYVSCGYWGDGDGDGFIGVGDLSILNAAIKGNKSYSNVYPANGETQDLDADGFLAAGDQSILSRIIKSLTIDPFPSKPTGIGRVEPSSGNTLSGSVGDTVSVVVNVTNVATMTSAGIPVVFSIDAGSSGSALILGGEGADGVNTRYDLSTFRATLPDIGGLSRVVLKLTGAGTVVVNAKVKQCGSGGAGRYCDEVSLAEPVTVTVTP